MESPQSVRSCLLCRKPISSMRGARAKYCSSRCGDDARKAKAKGTTAAKTETNKEILIHSCLARPEFCDPAKPKCRCRKWLTVEQAKALVETGDAIDFETRKSIFCNRAIVLVGLHKQTPRSQTIEKAHMQRGVGIVGEHRSKYDPEELRFRAEAARLRDREERAADERFRWKVWAELTAEFFKSITVEVPEDEFDKDKRESWGRPFIMGYSEERSSVGLNVGSAAGFAEGNAESREPDEGKLDEVSDESDRCGEDEDLTGLTLVEEQEEAA